MAASLKIFSKGWNFSQDGPGNRLVYHLQGCNFFCPWCSNPEGISPDGTLVAKEEILQDTACPYGAIQHGRLDRRLCSSCTDRVCIGKNRSEGIKRSCRDYRIAEIVDEIQQSRSLFYGGGGVTFTGGEPTLQFHTLKMLLQKLCTMSVNTVMETNGSNPLLPELFPFLDLLIMDIKHYDPAIHKQVIKQGNENTLDNLKRAASAGMKLWIRIPLIPGFNDGAEHILNFVSLIKPFCHEAMQVELLRYHEYGKIKWEQSGMEYSMESNQISASDYRKYQKMFTDNKIQIINT